MATSRECADYVLDQLSPVEGITARKMMGVYLLYCNGKLFGGIYDDREFLRELVTTLCAELQEKKKTK